MFEHTGSYGRGAYDQRAIGHGFGDGGKFAGLLQDSVSSDGRAGLTECDFVWIHQAKLGESEIAHSARGGSDIQRIARGNQDDFERTHGVCG